MDFRPPAPFCARFIRKPRPEHSLRPSLLESLRCRHVGFTALLILKRPPKGDTVRPGCLSPDLALAASLRDNGFCGGPQ